MTSHLPHIVSHECDDACAHTIDVGPVKVQCRDCNGTGIVGEVTPDMAEDAGDGHRAGELILCWTCIGTGWVERP